MQRARTVASILSVIVVLALGGCGVPAPAPTPTFTATPVAPSGDGVLRIATVLSSADPASAAQVAGVEVAVREINESGGWNGQPVTVIHRDAGEDATVAVAALDGRGIDVVVSGVVPEPLAGSIVLSPTGPGGSGGFSFAPAEFAEGAISLALDPGVATIAVLAADESTAERLSTALASDSTEVVLTDVILAGTSLTALASRVSKAEPEVTVIDGSAEAVAGLITALDARGVSGDELLLGGDAVADYSALLAAGILDGAVGARPGAELTPDVTSRLLGSDPGLATFTGAAEAHDAVIAAALAATLADDDGGPSIGAQLRIVADGAIPCSSYAECMDVLGAGEGIAYEGWSGSLRFDDQGNRVTSPLTLFGFSAENRPTIERVVAAD